MFRLIVLSSLVALALGASIKGKNLRLNGRIVGGEAVDVKDYPYQISLMYGGSHYCGGSIIAEKYVITAAHCTDGASASSLKVRAGTSTQGSGGEVIQVAKIHQHPDFDYYDIDFDITVLELVSPLTFDENTQPISFNSEEPAVGADAVTSGWGALSENGGSPTQLQAVTVQIVGQKACQDAYSGYSITDRMICAAVPGGGKDACQGDSGGPLAVDGKLVGVVSWGIGCARPNYPGVYSNVANLAGFVLDVTGPL